MVPSIKPPQTVVSAGQAAAAMAGAGEAAAQPATPAGNLAAAPASANVMDALKHLDEERKIVQTGVDGQANVQTLLQTQANIAENRVLPELQAAWNKQAAEQRDHAIAKV